MVAALRRVLVSGATWGAALALAPVALAGPADPDPAFAGGGTATADVGVDTGEAVAVAPDGKVVVAGRALVNGQSHVAVARFTSAGVLDTTFDGDGKASTPIANLTSVTGVAVQPNGGVVVSLVAPTPVTGGTDFTSLK